MAAKGCHCGTTIMCYFEKRFNSKEMPMKRKISSFILCAILFIGMSLLLYPTVSDYINSRNQSRAVRDYSTQVANMSNDSTEKMIEDAQDYNTRLAATQDAFYNPEKVAGYEQTLDVTGTGIMGYITIDKIGVMLPVYHGVNEAVLQIAVGHLPGTSLPVSGESSHIVLSGHRGLPSATLFTHLDELEVGDTFQIDVLKEQYTYRVDQVKIVLPIEVDDLQIEEGKEYCTLMTCTPYGVNSHRLLVRGVRIDVAREGDSNYVTNEAYQIDPVIVMPALAIPMFLVWLIVLGLRYRSKRKESERRRKINSLVD